MAKDAHTARMDYLKRIDDLVEETFNNILNARANEAQQVVEKNVSLWKSLKQKILSSSSLATSTKNELSNACDDGFRLYDKKVNQLFEE